jgi:hypothetical protein
MDGEDNVHVWTNIDREKRREMRRIYKVVECLLHYRLSFLLLAVLVHSRRLSLREVPSQFIEAHLP